MKHLLLIGCAVLLIVAFVSCGDDDNPVVSGNHAPTTPVIDTASGAPANGATDVALTAVLRWICTDADGDSITYTVYFGDTTTPPMIPVSQTSASFDPDTLEYSTTYYWMIVAEDANSATSSSAVWSFTTIDEVVAETVSVPDVPTGPTDGLTGISLSFSTGNAVSNLGHTLEYRFDWGGAVYSDWSSATTAIHSWSAVGTWTVKAQARCSTHNAVISDWSNASADLVITAPVETISAPDAPNGPASGTTDSSLDYSIAGAASSLGHTLEYRFDWDDGDTSLWSPTMTGGHAWTAAGTYDIALQARCVTHTSIESSWSGVTTVTITDLVETISTPDAPDGPVSGTTNSSLDYSIAGAVSSFGHALEYRFDWDDGDTSLWSPNFYGSHVWLAAGTYDIVLQARCITDTMIESSWSSVTTVTLTALAETISNPGSVSGSANAAVGESHTYTIYGSSSSNLGHTVEYRMDWDDGSFSDWSIEFTASHSWGSEGTYDVTAQARCAVDTSVLSGSTAAMVVTVTAALETISTPLQPDVTDTVPVNFNVSCWASGAVSSYGHTIEYRFDFGDSFIGLWPSEDPYSHQHRYTVPGSYLITTQARCVVDTSIMSAWGPSTSITVEETVSNPTTPVGPTSGVVGDTLTYTTGGSVSSEGHTVEYRIYFATGLGVPVDSTSWSTSTSHDLAFGSSGTFYGMAHARCTIDTNIVSYSPWSGLITISSKK